MKRNVAGMINALTVGICLITMTVPLSASEGNAQIFRNCLVDLGTRLDCFFSVESIGCSGWLNNPILDGLMSADASSVQDIDGLMAFLTNEVCITWKSEGGTNEIQLVADRVEHDGKSIIRICDARLMDIAGYALTNTISLEYEGSIDGLLKEMSSRENRIQPQRVISYGTGLVRIDTMTQVKVNVEDAVARDVLTTCISLDNYHRIVWSSYTDGQAESPAVMVKFYGQEWGKE
ncbi:MAG: hypothetical protein PHO14_01370 [Kiritimatiellae bacterium]|jgi:hypothetical protein|nr:hypothetical protein [Kiritimatiellia bacterium]MDD4340866.1 hypothetical protein [Kiritimatiellia bacterium]